MDKQNFYSGTLIGSVACNEVVKLKWVTEPNACKKCQELEGKLFNSVEEFEAARPHPHCKCKYEAVRFECNNQENTGDIEGVQNEKSDAMPNLEEIESVRAELQTLKEDSTKLKTKIDNTIPIIDEEIEELRYQQTDKIHYSTMEIEEIKKVKEKLQKIKDKLIKYSAELLKILSEIFRLDNISNFILNLSITTKEIKDKKAKVLDIGKLYSEDIGILLFGTRETALIFGKGHSEKYNLTDAYKCFEIAVNEDEREYIDKNGKMYNSIDDLTDERLKWEIKGAIFKETHEIPDARVFVLKQDSSIAEKILNSETLKKFLDENRNELMTYGKIPDTTMEFSSVDSDLYSTFHGVEVKHVHFDQDGNLHMLITDYYNFNKGRPSAKGKLGYKLQQQELLDPYYIVCPIVISKEKFLKH